MKTKQKPSNPKSKRKVLSRLSDSVNKISPVRRAVGRVFWEFKRRSDEYIKKPDPRLDPGKSWEELHSFHQGLILRSIRSGVKFTNSPHNSRAQISIDFGKISNVKALKEFILQQIDQFLILHPEHLKIERRSDQGQRDWDKVLRAGELEESGLMPGEIARRLFPAAFKSKRSNAAEQQEAARTNAAQLRAEYRRMIEGGYRELYYP